ncbi:DNA helicase [Tanacetum coccineum]
MSSNLFKMLLIDEELLEYRSYTSCCSEFKTILGNTGVSKPLGESSNVVGPSCSPVDEIQNYLEGRFICAHEAYWRILKFDIHRREPVVQILSVHLQDMQRFSFRDRDKLESVVNLSGRKSTTLTEWFAYNEANEDGQHLTYQDFPSEFVYVSATSSELRFVFAHILMHCDVTDPSRLWRKYGEMVTLIPERFSEGKTFLWKTIISTLRSEEKIVLEVALSGIASLLLPCGCIAHSRFKLLLELTEESLCRITKNSHLRKLLANTDLIIWDEAPMNDRRCFEALDRSLRDILTEPHSLFGGKSVLLGGDFRQTLLVKKRGVKNRAKPNISTNERILISLFASWLLDIDDGKTSKPDPQDPENTSWVDIPINYCTPDDENGL